MTLGKKLDRIQFLIETLRREKKELDWLNHPAGYLTLHVCLNVSGSHEPIRIEIPKSLKAELLETTKREYARKVRDLTDELNEYIP